MLVSSTLHIILNPIMNPNADKGNKHIKNTVCEGSMHITKVIAGANIIATIADINTVNPRISLIILISFILFVLICYSINITIKNDIKKSGVNYFSMIELSSML